MDVASVIAGSAFVVAKVGPVAAVTPIGAFVVNDLGLARCGFTGDALPVEPGSPSTSTWRYERTPDCSRPGFCPILIERSAAWPGDRASAAVVPTTEAARRRRVPREITRYEA